MASTRRKRACLIVLGAITISCLGLYSLNMIGNNEAVSVTPSVKSWSTPEEFSDLWSTATIAERRNYFDGLFGIDDVLAKTLNTADYTYKPDLQNSLIYGMSKEEVIGFLGLPDSDTDKRLAYEISVIKELRGLDKVVVGLGLHPGYEPSHMAIYFDEDNVVHKVSIPR